MRNVILLAAVLLMNAACAQKNTKAGNESIPATSITCIEDKEGGTMQPHKLYPEVPDSLWNALSLQDGVPSAMNCFLLQTEGKNILLDAGLGAPFSRLLPKLKELRVNPEELPLV